MTGNGHGGGRCRRLSESPVAAASPAEVTVVAAEARLVAVQEARGWAPVPRRLTPVPLPEARRRHRVRPSRGPESALGLA